MNFDVPFGTVEGEMVVTVLAPMKRFVSCFSDKFWLYLILAWWMFGSYGKLATSECSN